MIKNKKRFTLIELLAVIAILGILAAISVVSVSGVLNKSKKSISKLEESNIKSSFKMYLSENDCGEKIGGTYPALVIGGTVNNWTKCQMWVTDLVTNGYLEVDDPDNSDKYKDKFVITSTSPTETIIVNKCDSLNGKEDGDNCDFTSFIDLTGKPKLKKLCDIVGTDGTTVAADVARWDSFFVNPLSYTDTKNINPYLIEQISESYPRDNQTLLRIGDACLCASKNDTECNLN